MTALLPLKLTKATSRRQGRVLVGPIDLEISEPAIHVILGPNGAGKTSLLHLMHGTGRVSSGQVAWACDQETARHHQAFVFQKPVLLRRSVRENLIYSLRVRGVKRAIAEQRAETWLGRINLQDRGAQPAALLSGGEAQKLSIARALIADPKVLFLDEPCAALDGHAARDIEALLRNAHRNGTTLILSTHDLGQARRLADQCYFMLGGRLHEHAAAPTFFEKPKTSEARAFLGGEIVT